MNKTRVAWAVASVLTATALVACGSSDGPADASTAPAAVAAPFNVKVIGLNDFLGQLEAAGTFGVSTAVAVADRSPVGGAEFLAAHVAELKK